MLKPVFYVLGYRNAERISKFIRSFDALYSGVQMDQTVHNFPLWVCDNDPEHPMEEHKWMVEEPKASGDGLFYGPGGGFTPGINACIDHFWKTYGGDPYIPFFFNDDLELEPGFLENMLRVLEEHPRAGIVVPMQVLQDNPSIVICGGFGKAYPGGEHATGLRSDTAFVEKPYKWVTFCCMAIRSEVLRSVGKLNNYMTMYFSDSDYCVRARMAGFECWFTPNAVVRHENHAATTEFHSEDRRFRNFLMDQWMFEYVHGPGIMEYMSHS